MKRFLVCAMALMIVGITYAQDIILTTKAQKIEAKIIEVSKSKIKYKELDNLDGPTFVIETSEISSVIYANGKVGVYNQDTKPAEQPPVAPQQLATTQTGEDSATVLFLSGDIFKCEIAEMTNQYVAFMKNGEKKYIPATQIEKVTLPNGQVKTYSHSETSSATVENEDKNTKPKYVHREGNTYYYDGQAMNERAYLAFLRNNCPEAYTQYYKGYKCAAVGWALFAVGVSMDIGATVSLINDIANNVIYSRTSSDTTPNLSSVTISLGLIGACFEIACIPTLIVGYNQKHESVSVYNGKCAYKSKPKAYWSINASQNGIGLAYNF